ncbi:hypothetical protein [Halobacterium jilantaiense]|uniref:Uncharacterized protein n=1 Tax=Halobacterium jilantaiense TaxID=355548 RepID=A0A1I0P7F4_9EURY|nr:hypothetical protein [Halobacterium jilantaiense]SEW10201.1 hypothetical protein SAMN04487945_1457 [Halobacterium jilantaiense]
MAATSDAMDALDELADPEFWMQAGAVFTGFMGPTVAKNLIEPNTSYDIPDEAYGALVVAGAQYSPAYKRELMLGGGLYTVDQLAVRYNLKQHIQEAGN